jgi:hypothetical protein
MGCIESAVKTDGSVEIRLSANKNEVGSTQTSSIMAKMSASGVASAEAPAPASNSNGNNIATTAWVRTKINEAFSYNSSTGTLTLGL